MESDMPTIYHPARLKQLLHMLKYRNAGLTSDPESTGLYVGWFDDPTSYLSYIGEAPSPEHVLVHLDKSKWYGPGNVKWGTKTLRSALRVDNPKLRDYYARRKPVQPTAPAPRSTLYEGKTLRQWSQQSGVSLYMLSRALDHKPNDSIADAIQLARSLKGSPHDLSTRRGRPAQLYEGKTLQQWADHAGVSLYYIRKHLTPVSTMAEVIRQAKMDISRRE